MNVRKNPKQNIRLFELHYLERGYISIRDVRAIEHREYNFAINLNATIYSRKSDKNCIPVVGTGDKKLDFEVDLSSFIVRYLSPYISLPKSKDFDWHLFEVGFDRNVLVDYDDLRGVEYFIDEWLTSSEPEKADVAMELSFYLDDFYQKKNISYILGDRISLMSSISRLKDWKLGVQNEFSIYTKGEREAILELYYLQLDFINSFLMAKGRWKLLDKQTYLSIRDYWIKQEEYEILIEPSKYFKL